MDPARIRDALAGAPDAVDELMRAATPVIQARVARALLRRPESRGRDLRQEIADFTQDVFVALFSADGKALRAWDPQRGLSFANFVGLLAQRRVSSMLRTRQGSPWSEELHADAAHEESTGQPAPDADAGSRELLRRVLEELEASLSARGMELFQRLYVAQESVEDVCEQTGLSANAVHQWRRRLGIAAREVLERLQREQRQSEPERQPIRSGRVAVGVGAEPDRARRVR
ncbi:MAG TPA: sigma-70 family RNA polymerase sigma factor [Polyangiales bacterium]|nr:sigma-70 family RNA polymerase sigma factor [Polyangiales bacterium]